MKVLSLLLFFSLTACSSFGKFMKGLVSDDTPQKVAKANQPQKKITSYKSRPNFGRKTGLPKKYGRMTVDRFEAEAKINENDGSLWVDEGQNSFLFTQNKRRQEGDILNVRLEDAATKQLQSKVNVISSLIKAKQSAKRTIANAAANTVSGAANKVASKIDTTGQSQAQPQQNFQKKKEQADTNLNVKTVPSRVVATYPDGSYRVMGSQNVLIDGTEFKVLVTGLVKGKDIADDSVASSKMLDSKFDIVTTKRSF